MPATFRQGGWTHKDYRVGWICALPCEMAAAICMLDERHPQLSQPESDHNSYTFGSIKEHNVVIACLPNGVMGTTSAARVATQMRFTFTSLRFGLMVGIGGGAPSPEHDIRLGDVVVSRPVGAYGGVIQYDYGKTVHQGQFVQTGSLNRPPDILLNAMTQLQARNLTEDDQLPEIIQESITRYPRRKTASTYPGKELDQLFHWTYDHVKPSVPPADPHVSNAWTIGYPSLSVSCDLCDKRYLVNRNHDRSINPVVHYGLIASGNQVVRDGKTRERLRQEKDILCFEMEAAGIVDEFPCAVIRGVCDYADSHKHKKWQDYAATTAAAYARELLTCVPTWTSEKESGFESFQSVTRRFHIGNGAEEHRGDRDEAILNSLAFTGMFERRNNVERRHPNTCSWILGSEDFRNWQNNSHGLLWIKGIPGAGKSTIMAFLYDCFRQSHQTTSTTRLDFFFHARGTPLQKQFVGLLRSMIYQIFKQNDTIRSRVRRLYLEKSSETAIGIEHSFWHQNELESLFFEVIEVSAQSGEVLVFVDALDEAGAHSARHIALLFHRLNERVTMQAGKAKFCISSRHYPVVVTIPGTEISVERFNRADIEKYVLDNLPLSLLLGPDPDDLRVWMQLRRDLVSKASGSFQWARVTIPLVEMYITDGKSALEIYDLIQEAPDALHEVYSHVLQHVINREDRLKSLSLLQWICFAQRPMKVVELRYALAASQLHIHQASIPCIKMKNFIRSNDQMKRLVRALSGGLVEIEVNQYKDEAYASPIHQSVNDFLVPRGLMMLSAADLNSTTSHTLNVSQSSHAVIFQACLNYLLAEDLVVLMQEAQTIRTEKRAERSSFQHWGIEMDHDDVRSASPPRSDYDEAMLSLTGKVIQTVRPTLLPSPPKYAGYQLFRMGEDEVIPPIPTMSSLDWPPDYSKLPLEIEYDQDTFFGSINNVDPGGDMNFDLTSSNVANVPDPTHNSDSSSLSVPVPRARSVSPREGWDSSGREVRRDKYLVRNVERLLDDRAPFLRYSLTYLFTHAVNLPEDHFAVHLQDAKALQRVLSIWKEGQIAIGNLQSSRDHPNSGTTLLHIAAAANVLPLARYLLQSVETSIDEVDARRNTAIHLAIAGGHEKMISLLLEAHPDLLIRDNGNMTPLGSAFRYTSPPGAVSIIQYCSNRSRYKNELERMLGVAVLKGSETLVRLLLESGVDPNSKKVKALHKAAKCGHLAIVLLLLEKGADINAEADLFGSPLQAACFHRHPEVVKLLLARGADRASRGARAGHRFAKSRGHDEIVKMMAEAGVG